MDRQGRSWRVWSTIPTVPRALSPAFEGGWLTFEAGDDLRRYAPIPPHWTDLSDDRLEILCRAATPATTRRTPPRGTKHDSGDADAR